jgi:hypothetical protein
MNIKDVVIGAELDCQLHPKNPIFQPISCEVLSMGSGWVTILDDKGMSHKVRASQLSPTVESMVANEESAEAENTTEADIEDLAEDSAPEESAEAKPRNPMSQHIIGHSKNYVTSLNVNGDKTRICGDELSVVLLKFSVDEIVQMAGTIKGCSLVEKYAALNPGQRRMNAGNIIRSALKKGKVTISAIEKMLDE